MQVHDRHPDGPESRVGISVRRLFSLTTVALAGFLAAYLVPAHLPEAAAAPDASIDPRAARAFERNIAYNLPAGESHVEAFIELPPGVITVIEHVSLRCNVPQGES